MLIECPRPWHNLTRLVPFNKLETMAAEYCIAATTAAQPAMAR
jgi:hypothetical protein